MKKQIITAACLIIAAAILTCSCGKSTTVTPATAASTLTASMAAVTTTAAGQKAYVAPAKFAKLDLSKKDISTDSMKFTYDGDGRIISCTYDYGAGTCLVSYIYADNSIGVTATIGTTKVAEESFAQASAFASNAGYTSYEGYYFFGYSF